MSDIKNKKDYEHYIPAAKKDENFPAAYNFILVSSIEQLNEIVSHNFNYISFDTETSSLNPEEGFLVGYSFCYDGVSAYYVPVKHFSWGLGKEAVDIIHRLLLKMKKVFMFNARFDMRFMEYSGYDMSSVQYYDVAVAINMADTNITKYSLKWAEEHFLGWKADTFSETIGENATFYYVEPENAYFYAGTDALGTFKLANKTLMYYREGGVSAKIDNQVLYPLQKMEETPILIDINWLKKCSEEAKNSILETERNIYNEVGYTFDINSNKQKADALSSLGISTGVRTRTGNMAVSIKVFDSLIDSYKKRGEEPPKILSYLQDYAKMFKLDGSYIETLLSSALKRENHSLRFSYKTGIAPTGRLACGKDGKNTFFAPINLQSIPKPHPKMWYYRKAVPESDPEHTVLGWEFSLTPFGLGDEERWCEGKDPKLNVRNAFIPEKGQYWFCIDFCIDPNTEVELENGKKVPLKYLENNPQKIKTPDGYQKAYNFRYTGKKKVCELELIDGRIIRCSEDHRFKVRTVDNRVIWKKFKEIVDTDYIFTEETED